MHAALFDRDVGVAWGWSGACCRQTEQTGKKRQRNNQKDQHRFASHLTLRRNVLLSIKGNPLLSVYKPISRFYIGRETVIQIARFVTLVCCINYVVIRVIKIVLLASLQLVFPLDELSNILLGEKK